VNGRVRVAVAAVGTALVVGGCGGSEQSPSQSQGGPAESVTASATASGSGSSGALVAGVTGFGLSRSPAGSGLPDYLWAVTMVQNKTDQLTGLTASFSAFDAGGKVVGQSDTSAPVMRAGAAMAVGTQVQVPAGTKVDKVVATVSPLANVSQKDDHPEWKFSATGVHFQPGSYGDSKVLGEVVSGYPQPVKQVYVSVVCYDARGAIIGGGEHYVDSIGPGQRVGFATDTLAVSGKPARCAAYPTVSAGSG
jgi:hypothetical protein